MITAFLRLSATVSTLNVLTQYHSVTDGRTDGHLDDG